jgi:hypothetical protein
MPLALKAFPLKMQLKTADPKRLLDFSRHEGRMPAVSA